MKQKSKKVDGFVSMFMSTLGASSLANMFVG